MATERMASVEDHSVWNSRLFKIGAVTAVVGAVVKWWNVAATGVVLAGAAWAWWKGKK